MKKLDQHGVTLVELMIAVGVLSVIAASVMSARYYTARQTVRNSDKAFATQKAVQMIEELKVLVSGREVLGGRTLVSCADGAAIYNPMLTTDVNVTNPADPLSQNVPIGGGWKFLRHIDVAGLPSDPNGAIVTVRVYRTSDGVTRGEELSTITTVLRTIVSTFPPTQSMDVYILALQNIQGWWSQVSDMRKTFDAILASLAAANPGLEIRSHYITRTGFGRDAYYKPYINSSQRTDQFNIPSVYLYPGLTRDQNNNSVTYFDPQQLRECGNINVDGAPWSTTGLWAGCPSYSVCDMYNHGMRYPDELATYQAVTQSAAIAGVSLPEISLRMLMEGMYSQPASFRNAIILNLHGELLPMPAMRNYSDAAKSPVASPNARVVVHPENLRYNSSNDINLRVYGYVDGLSNATALDTIPVSLTAPTITILLPDLAVVPANIAITAVVGSDAVTYSRVPLLSGAASMGMSWTASNPGGTQTLITLYNTPLRHVGHVGNGGGLKPHNRLYGLEYIPSPIGGNFNQDLTDTSAANNNPKNTARWIISLKNLTGADDGQHTIETRIGPSTMTAPPNMSRTYVWLGVDPPITEQFQFLGDPRHCPYQDVVANQGYNWFFRNVADGYQTTFTRAVTCWGNDGDERDVPRYLSILRRGLLNSQAIWTTMNGFSYYYMGQGGEFGSDAAPFTPGLYFRRGPWSGSNDTTVETVDEILPDHATRRRSRLVASTNNQWFAKYWMGELYPDSQDPTWQSTGNLPTATGFSVPTTFYRAEYTNFAPITASNPTCSGFRRGTAPNGVLVGGLGQNGTAKRLSREGCISFLNGTSQTLPTVRTFRHDSNNGLGNIQPLGTTCYPIFFMPLASPVSCTRPWTLNFTSSAGNPFPTEWNTAPYNGSPERTALAFSAPSTWGTRVFYSSNYNPTTAPNNGWNPFCASGVIRMSDSANNSAFIIVSGLSVQANFGTYELGKSAFVFMLRTFLDGGLYGGTTHIPQLPLITLQDPPQAAQLNNPSSYPVSWTSVWQRWGGVPYTEEYPTGWTETSVPIDYNVKYSSDTGATWRNLSDNSLTTAGQLDAGHVVTSGPVTWDLSDTMAFPRGNYSVRVEGYRQNMPLHYSYHQANIYINR